MPQTILFAATSKFAFLKTITGFVPLNSRVNGVKFFEANFIIDFPVSVLPVKKMWSKFCSINFMDCLLSPSTVIRTSLRKYLEVSFLISFEVAGHFSDGFITAVFPAEKIFTNGFKI